MTVRLLKQSQRAKSALPAKEIMFERTHSKLNLSAAKIARWQSCLLMLGTLIVFVSSVGAQEEIVGGIECKSAIDKQVAPRGGVELLGANPLTAFSLSGAEAGKASLQIIEVERGRQALRVELKEPSSRPDAVTLQAKSVASITPGDTLFLRWQARTISSDAADGKARAELKTRAAFTGLSFVGTKQDDWKVRALPVPAWLEFAKGEMPITINVGASARQTIEISNLELVNYKNLFAPAQLPFSCTTYEGHASDAVWRKEAEQRIERFRKSDLKVSVVDEAGQAIPNASVKIEMQRHAFGFGTAVNEHRLVPQSGTPDEVKYRTAILENFNEVVIENGLKWKGWENADSRRKTLTAIEWLNKNRTPVRGHTLVWASWRNSPERLKTQYEQTLKTRGEARAKQELDDEIKTRINDTARALRGKLIDWDVVNETYANHDFQDLLGKQKLIEWYKLARLADDKATLYLNENTVETETSAKSDFYFNEVKYLIDNGAPIGGIGLQAHIAAISIPSYLRNLDRFATFNLPLKITEFDFVTPDKQLQADLTRDFLIATFSHPAMRSFLMWGFWDGHQWLHDAPLYNKDWTLKPSGQAYRDLVFGKWWTRAEGVTDARGAYQTRGFLGDYEITVKHNGKQSKEAVKLMSEGATVKLVIKNQSSV